MRPRGGSCAGPPPLCCRAAPACLAPPDMRILLTGYSDLAAIVGSVNDSEVFRFVSNP